MAGRLEFEEDRTVPRCSTEEDNGIYSPKIFKGHTSFQYEKGLDRGGEKTSNLVLEATSFMEVIWQFFMERFRRLCRL